MPDVNWNRQIWDGSHDWANHGEEWSAAWGGSEPQWFGSLYPRLHRVLPAKSILELAPGMGRWTKFLLPLCHKYLGIDLSLECVQGCQKVFTKASHARFVQNDGYSLEEAEDGSFDFIFSFDSLVHVELDIFKSYVPQILRKLNMNGVAFIHHSNLGAFGTALGMPHARAQSVSRQNIESLIVESGGQVLIQEVITWVGNVPQDCLTLFSKRAGKDVKAVHLHNLQFMEEAEVVRQFQAPYSQIDGGRGQQPERL
jgi:SAM-dependent methyltransferase